MPVLTITGDMDPFLHVSLRQGEIIFCESDAMVMMEVTWISPVRYRAV